MAKPLYKVWRTNKLISDKKEFYLKSNAITYAGKLLESTPKGTHIFIKRIKYDKST